MFQLKAGDRPFVVAVKAISHERQEFVAVPIGIEFGSCPLEVWNRAAARWPMFEVLGPLAWEEASQELRMSAIESDRMNPAITPPFGL